MKNIAVTVNGAAIGHKEVNAAMQSLAQEHFHATLDQLPVASHKELKSMAIERLIARELIFQAALAEGFVADSTAIEDEKQRVLRMVGNPDDFFKRLAERGMDEAAFLRMVRKDATVDQLSARKLAEVRPPGEGEITAFFSAHQDKLHDPERVRVSHILVAVDPEDPDKALQYARSLKGKVAQEGFETVAKRYSTCVSAPGGGELGFIRREDVDPAFADAAFSQPLEEVGEPVRTPYGYHLILVTARDIPPPPSLADSRNKIIGFLNRINGSTLLSEWVAELRKHAVIVIHED